MSMPDPTDGLKLLIAVAMGLLIGRVQRSGNREQPISRSMAQAHVLLCLAGALTMMIIGDSVARAFGIAGAASVVRFRTAVDDPRDITVLFLLMALGMAAGLGLFAVAGLGTLVLGLGLLIMDRTEVRAPRAMKVALVAEGKSFPAAHVSRVFAEHNVQVAPIEMVHADHATVRYRATMRSDASLEALSAALLGRGPDGSDALRSVSWEQSKKGA